MKKPRKRKMEKKKQVSILKADGTPKTKSEYLTESGMYEFEKYLVHDNSFLLFGRRLVQAINLRIAFQQTAVEYFKARLTEYKIGRQNPSTKRKVERFEAELAKENTALRFYLDLRNKLYYQVDQILKDKTQEYRDVFKWCFLEGNSAKEIREKYKMDNKTLGRALQQIKDDLFDKGEYTI